MYRSSVAIQNSTGATVSALPNRRSRFVRKVRFGARRRDFSAVTTKIFLLPNRATQSPRTRLFAAVPESMRRRSPIDRRHRKLKNAQLYRRFLQYRPATVRIASPFSASMRDHVVMSPTSSLRVLALSPVNTSLSGKLFF
jgi:hypothetical protein